MSYGPGVSLQSFLSLVITATAFPATISARPPRSAAWMLIAGAAAAMLLREFRSHAGRVTRAVAHAT